MQNQIPVGPLFRDLCLRLLPRPFSPTTVQGCLPTNFFSPSLLLSYSVPGCVRACRSFLVWIGSQRAYDRVTLLLLLLLLLLAGRVDRARRHSAPGRCINVLPLFVPRTTRKIYPDPRVESRDQISQEIEAITRLDAEDDSLPIILRIRVISVPLPRPRLRRKRRGTRHRRDRDNDFRRAAGSGNIIWHLVRADSCRRK